MNEQAKQAVFEIRHLQTWFPVRKGVFKRHIGDLKAVDDVSLTVYQGETLGIVGESGCGKSTLGKSIMRLENPTGGEVFYNFDGKYKDIMKFNSQELFQFRKRVQMVFQDPYSALNPIKRVYDFLRPTEGTRLQRPGEASGNDRRGTAPCQHSPGLSDALPA